MSDFENVKEIEIPKPINTPKASEKHKVSSKQIKADEYNVYVKKTQTSRFEPPPVLVELPSHGYLYRGKVNDQEVADGLIRIRPMTLNEEKILTTDRLVRQGVALDLILENTIKSNVDPYELLSADRMYLLFYLRGMSYGLEYEFDVKCYHCGYNFIQSIEIDKLPIKEWLTPEDAQEPVVIELPISKAIVEAHFMRGKEERKLTEIEKSSRSYSETDESVSNTILYLVDKVTLSDGEVLSPKDKNDFLNNLIAADIDYIRDVLSDRTPGIRSIDNIICPNCDGVLSLNIPLGRNFFRRSRPGKKL